MSSFDFIIDNIKFSYSSLTTYETCPYSFKLTYIDKCEREENFYGQYGTLVHETMYQYFSNQLDMFELSGYFLDNYDKVVQAYPPVYPAGLGETYRDAGLEFFDNFSFDKSGYDVIMNEEKVEFEFDDGVQFVGRPDLVLFEKRKGDFSLVDYKTSAPFKINRRTGNEVTDTKKIAGYHKQMYIYTYALRNYKFTPINKITLWFTRPNRKLTIDWKEADEEKAIRWLKRQVSAIKKDEKFLFNNSNSYFCNNLCSVRESCEYRPEI